MSAAKARLSRRSVSGPKVERNSSGVPFADCARGKRLMSPFTQTGAYSENAFFQLPNHNSTR